MHNETIFGLSKCSACVYLPNINILTHSAELNIVFGDMCTVATSKSILYPFIHCPKSQDFIVRSPHRRFYMLKRRIFIMTQTTFRDCRLHFYAFYFYLSRNSCTRGDFISHISEVAALRKPLLRQQVHSFILSRQNAGTK